LALRHSIPLLLLPLWLQPLRLWHPLCPLQVPLHLLCLHLLALHLLCLPLPLRALWRMASSTHTPAIWRLFSRPVLRAPCLSCPLVPPSLLVKWVCVPSPPRRGVGRHHSRVLVPANVRGQLGRMQGDLLPLYLLPAPLAGHAYQHNPLAKGALGPYYPVQIRNPGLYLPQPALPAPDQLPLCIMEQRGWVLPPGGSPQQLLLHLAVPPGQPLGH